MDARTRALTFIIFSYFALACGTEALAQTVVYSGGTEDAPTVISGAVVQNGPEEEDPNAGRPLVVREEVPASSAGMTGAGAGETATSGEGVALPDQDDWRALTGQELPYNPTDGQASASILGAAPTLKTPSPVQGLCWSKSDGHFALTEQNAIFIRDGYDNRLVHTIGYDGATSLQFAWDVVTQTDMFMALSAGGKFSVWNFKDLPQQVAIPGEAAPSYSVELTSDKRVTASAFSHSGNHMAVAFDDGSVNMSIVLHYTQKISDKSLTGHLGNVFSLDFSRNDGFLASAGLDDKIFIWNATDGSKVNSMPFYSGSGAGVLFTSDSSSIISLERPDLITLRAFDGTRRMVIKPNGKNVKALRLSSNGKNLIALTADDKLEFYELATGKYIGYIPPFNQTTLTSFAFNKNDSVVLTGHADGSVYKLKLEKVFLKPGQKIPRMRMVGPDEVVVKGPGYTDKIPGSKDKAEIFPQEHSVLVGLSGRTCPKPYLWGLDLDVKARFVIKNTPVFIGGGAQAGLGFPGESFPYKYTIAEAYVSPPYLVGFTFSAPIGVQVKLGKKAPRLIAELYPAYRMEKLAQTGSGKIAASKWFSAFVAGATVGFGWKYFEFGGGAEYDTILGFYPKGYVAGRIPLKISGGKKKAAADKKEDKK